MRQSLVLASNFFDTGRPAHRQRGCMGELGPCRDQPRIGVERETVVRGIIEQIMDQIYSDLDTDLKALQATLEKFARVARHDPKRPF